MMRDSVATRVLVMMKDSPAVTKDSAAADSETKDLKIMEEE